MTDVSTASSQLVTSGVLPVAGVVLAGFLLKGRTGISKVWKEWTDEAGKERDKLDKDRETLSLAKDAAMASCQTRLTAAEVRVEELHARINRLMDSIMWWRSFARDLRADWIAAMLLHQRYEQLHGIDPLVQPDPPVIPRISEQDQVADFAD